MKRGLEPSVYPEDTGSLLGPWELNLSNLQRHSLEYLPQNRPTVSEAEETHVLPLKLVQITVLQGAFSSTELLFPISMGNASLAAAVSAVSSCTRCFLRLRNFVPHLPPEQPPLLPVQGTPLPHKRDMLSSSKHPLHAASAGLLLPPSLERSVLRVTPAPSCLDRGPHRQTQVTNSYPLRKTLPRKHGPGSTVSSHKRFLHSIFLPLQNCISWDRDTLGFPSLPSLGETVTGTEATSP